jgi:glutaminyl-peptide cyclotransferase
MSKLTPKISLVIIAALMLIILSSATLTAQTAVPEIQLLQPEVIAVYPHDSGSYTQGLVWDDGVFYESAGQINESDVRKVDPETGEVLAIRDLNRVFFAEGLALVDDRLIQLTWQTGLAFVYDRNTLAYQRLFRYEGEGWGLCYDGSELYLSDGTELISVRDPQTFELIRQIPVTFQNQSITGLSLQGRALDDLNELECVGDSLYVNVWQTDGILIIDKATGTITGLIDASQLLTPEERSALPFGAVLNGIAYNSDEDVFYLTGKYWPKLFEVRFVPIEGL